ncbi:Fic family protein, partial [Sinorhizobium meliloti]|nr:Fic family protein [Sinorhizobium meliloti]
AWLEFFLDGVAETADQAFETANRIARLFDDNRERIVRESERTGSVLQIHDIMRTSPYLTAASAAKRSALTVPTVNAALDQLQRLGIVEEATGRRRGRVFVYRAYMDILSDGAGTNAARS